MSKETKIWMIIIAICIGLYWSISEAEAKIRRSSAAVAEFKRYHKCPGTGRIEKRCDGFIVDHRIPLYCGGKDDPSNMQWQSVAESREKDKWEIRDCSIWF